MASKHLLGAVATLIGLIIGAGVLGIPAVIAKSGFLIGAVHIVVLGIAAMLINLYVGEIALRTEGKHQLTAYAGKYLGRWGKHAMLIALLITIYGALAAYLVGESVSISGLFGISPAVAMAVFFALMAVLVFRGLNIIEGAELYLNIFRFAAIAVLLAFVLMKLDLQNLAAVNLQYSFLPYGVVFFALMGASAVPAVKEVLKTNRKLVKRAIIIGSLFPVVFYLLFAFAFVGAFGDSVGEIATADLGMGGYIAAFGNIFAIVSMATAFLVLALALKWVYEYDYKINRHVAFLLTCAVPLVLVLAGVSRFSAVLGITGAVAGGLEGIIVVLMHRKAAAHGKPEYSIKAPWIADILLISLFIAGIIYTVATL
ncbi:MAG TPA: hypothetical protein HA362_02575 [Nanoarchaeota archaeon]|nr:hypothetical protein [Nanoarchaeota archaeon]